MYELGDRLIGMNILCLVNSKSDIAFPEEKKKKSEKPTEIWVHT